MDVPSIDSPKNTNGMSSTKNVDMEATLQPTDIRSKRYGRTTKEMATVSEIHLLINLSYSAESTCPANGIFRGEAKMGILDGKATYYT